MKTEIEELQSALSNILFEEGEVEAEVDGDGKFVTLYAEDKLLANRIRVRAIAEAAAPRFANLTLDIKRREASVKPRGKKAVNPDLTDAEFEVLSYLLTNTDTIVPRRDLAVAVSTTEKTVRTHVESVRKKLREAGWLGGITFVHRRGYRLDG